MAFSRGLKTPFFDVIAKCRSALNIIAHPKSSLSESHFGNKNYRFKSNHPCAEVLKIKPYNLDTRSLQIEDGRASYIFDDAQLMEIIESFSIEFEEE